MKYPELAALLATLEWSLADLARKLGWSPGTVRNWNKPAYTVPPEVAAWLRRHAARYEAWQAQAWRDDPPPLRKIIAHDDKTALT